MFAAVVHSMQASPVEVERRRSSSLRRKTSSGRLLCVDRSGTETTGRCFCGASWLWRICLLYFFLWWKDALSSFSRRMAKQFIIIDEWDALFREEKNDENIQQEYVRLLRGLFKGGTATDEAIAAVFQSAAKGVKMFIGKEDRQEMNNI